jgi:hypothetical protein
MKALAVLMAGLVLAGCSLAPLIKSDSVDYNETYDEVTNIGLVTNILRARDHAPLNFSTLSDIRTGISTSGSASENLPIGSVARSTTRGTEGVGLSLSISPSFEIAPIDTQTFTRGILAPIDPMIVKYYFDRNISQKLLMYLLFSEISVAIPAPPEENGTGKAPSSIPVAQLFNDPTQPRELERFIAFVDQVFPAGASDLHVVHANSYTPLEPVGPAFPYAPTVENLKDLLSVDPSRHRLFYDPRTKMARLYTVASHPEVIFCKESAPLPLLAAPNAGFAPEVLPPGTARMSPAARAKLQQQIAERNRRGEEFFAQLRDVEKSICNSGTATMSVAGDTGSATFGTIYIRSVEGIIQYLGALLRDNPAAAESRALIDRDLKYDLISLSTRSAGSRFGVDYYGRTYYVRNFGPDDRTLQVLALLSQLLNLNKVASEIPTTRPVEIVP